MIVGNGSLRIVKNFVEESTLILEDKKTTKTCQSVKGEPTRIPVKLKISWMNPGEFLKYADMKVQREQSLQSTECRVTNSSRSSTVCGGGPEMMCAGVTVKIKLFNEFGMGSHEICEDANKVQVRCQLHGVRNKKSVFTLPEGGVQLGFISAKGGFSKF